MKKPKLVNITIENTKKRKLPKEKRKIIKKIEKKFNKIRNKIINQDKLYLKWKKKLISLFNKKYPKKGKEIFDKWAAEFIFDFYDGLTPLQVFYNNINIGKYL